MGSSLELRELASRLDLAPAIVSIVLSNSPMAEPIPPLIRDRILSAAHEFGYAAGPQDSAKMRRRSFTIGILVPEVAEGYFPLVLNGIEGHLLRAGYLHCIVSHQHRPELLAEYERLFLKSEIDGLVLVNTSLSQAVQVPAVSLSGHVAVEGVTNLGIDHDWAAHLALTHLYDLGHRKICFIKGQEHSGDANVRWESMMVKARSLGLTINPDLCAYIQTNAWSPELGYPVMKDILGRTREFTAVVCFNDFVAMGAIRALHDHGIRCPDDVSVIGFDDIASARFCIPGLTTIRQPLKRMGELAAQMLLHRIEAPTEKFSSSLILQPELVIRESTARIPLTALSRHSDRLQ